MTRPTIRLVLEYAPESAVFTGTSISRSSGALSVVPAGMSSRTTTTRTVSSGSPSSGATATVSLSWLLSQEAVSTAVTRPTTSAARSSTPPEAILNRRTDMA